MSMYQVDSDRVFRASGGVATSIDTIREQVRLMRGQLDELRLSWTGGAASAFDTVIGEWQVTQTQVEATLGRIADALGRASTTYATAEQDARSLFG